MHRGGVFGKRFLGDLFSTNVVPEVGGEEFTVAGSVYGVTILMASATHHDDANEEEDGH